MQVHTIAGRPRDKCHMSRITMGMGSGPYECQCSGPAFHPTTQQLRPGLIQAMIQGKLRSSSFIGPFGAEEGVSIASRTVARTPSQALAESTLAMRRQVADRRKAQWTNHLDAMPKRQPRRLKRTVFKQLKERMPGRTVDKPTDRTMKRPAAVKKRPAAMKRPACKRRK